MTQMEGSDYINASFIDSPLRSHNYIAAQVMQMLVAVLMRT